MATAPYKKTSPEILEELHKDKVLAAEASLEQKNGSKLYVPRSVSVAEKAEAISQTMKIIMGS